MTRDQLEHIIRACADIMDQYEIMVVGSVGTREAAREVRECEVVG